jgi:hypothetical protein
MKLAGLLDERPGVRSMARAVAGVLTVLTAFVVVFCCWLAGYAIVHAKDHAEHAALAINSASQLINQVGIFVLAPCIGGIWIGLGMRKRTHDDATQARVTYEGPANAQPVLNVAPAVPEPPTQ